MQELVAKNILLVSGHHGVLDLKPNRLIIDEGGGLEENPITAIVLPYRKLVRSNESLTSLEASSVEDPQKVLAHALCDC